MCPSQTFHLWPRTWGDEDQFKRDVPKGWSLITNLHLSFLRFPSVQASHADIPQKSKKKGTSYGFVQFASPGDAKAAFDAAKDLTIADHKITVLFAKITETKPEVLQRKAEKRKARNDAKKKQGEEDEDQEEVKTEKKAEKRKAVKDEESANIKKGKTSETAKALKDEQEKEMEDDSV
jgi:hypothetical protein